MSRPPPGYPMNSTRSALPAFISACRSAVSSADGRRRACTTIHHPRDDHAPILERLAQDLDRVAAEPCEVIEEQHPVVPERDAITPDGTVTWSVVRGSSGVGSAETMIGAGLRLRGPQAPEPHGYLQRPIVVVAITGIAPESKCIREPRGIRSDPGWRSVPGLRPGIGPFPVTDQNRSPPESPPPFQLSCMSSSMGWASSVPSALATTQAPQA
jgi:hypothetical protein